MNREQPQRQKWADSKKCVLHPRGTQYKCHARHLHKSLWKIIDCFFIELTLTSKHSNHILKAIRTYQINQERSGYAAVTKETTYPCGLQHKGVLLTLNIYTTQADEDAPLHHPTLELTVQSHPLMKCRWSLRLKKKGNDSGSLRADS